MDKLTYLTRQWLEGVTERPTSLFVFAHSGATIEPTNEEDRRGEVAFSLAFFSTCMFSMVLQQLVDNVLPVLDSFTMINGSFAYLGNTLWI